MRVVYERAGPAARRAEPAYGPPLLAARIDDFFQREVREGGGHLRGYEGAHAVRHHRRVMRRQERRHVRVQESLELLGRESEAAMAEEGAPGPREGAPAGMERRRAERLLHGFLELSQELEHRRAPAHGLLEGRRIEKRAVEVEEVVHDYAGTRAVNASGTNSAAERDPMRTVSPSTIAGICRRERTRTCVVCTTVTFASSRHAPKAAAVARPTTSAMELTSMTAASNPGYSSGSAADMSGQITLTASAEPACASSKA